MIPSKLDLLFWRGASFEMELISQVKSYNFDPAVNNSPADLRRTHAENLEFYGFTWDYIDFTTEYANAALIVMKPWKQNYDEEREPLLELTILNGRLQFTDSSILIGLDADETQGLKFDSGIYKLQLVTTGGKIDLLTEGTVTVKGER